MHKCNAKGKMISVVNNVNRIFMLQSRRTFPEMNSVYTSAVNNGKTIGIGIFMLQSGRKFAAQMTSVDDAHVMAIHLAIHLVKTGVTKHHPFQIYSSCRTTVERIMGQKSTLPCIRYSNNTIAKNLAVLGLTSDMYDAYYLQLPHIKSRLSIVNF